MTCYTVFKRTGTHADVLAAIGAADVLRHIEPRIVELEDRFEIRLRKRLALSDLGAVDPGFSYLERARTPAAGLPPERIRHGCDAPVKNDGNSLAGAPENRMYAILGRMKAYGGPNKVVSLFAKMNRQQWTRNVWTSLHGEPGFALSSPLVQLFNPQSGKGYALLKPSGTNRRDKTKDRWAEPFHEWLRFRGYFEGAAGWFTEGDLRLFCPIPADIPYDQFAAVADAFRELRLGGTAVKIDCRAVLALARLLVERLETHRPPRQAIRGLWATQYKDMGQAHTIMAMEQLALPDWFALRTREDAQLWLETLEEHDTVLRRLTDNHSDEFALLKQYRRTFQTRWQDSIPEFVKFLGDYGALLFQRRARDYWLLPQFKVANIAAILNRDPQLRAMLRNPGFLAVAGAIRSSTVGAQAARYHSRAGHREIRYGLLADIRRTDSLGRKDLLERTSAFIDVFNQEGTRRRAAGLRAMQIQDTEWAKFAALIEHLPSGVAAGSLLCGLSTCLPGVAAAIGTEPKVIQAASA